MENKSQKDILPDNFSMMAAHWNDLDPAKIDDSLYYSSPRLGGESDWFRVVVFNMYESDSKIPLNLERFKGQLPTSEVCRVWMGINKTNDDSPAYYFEPFLELPDETANALMPTARNCFKLDPVDLLALMRQPEPSVHNKNVLDFMLSSDIIPETFAYEMKTNWLHCAPSGMADHFKVMEYKSDNGRQLPLLKYVRHYIFYAAENLADAAGPNAISQIIGLSVALGLDLNKKATKLPTFSPILIYTLETLDNNNKPVHTTVYEELSRPCPPTCD